MRWLIAVEVAGSLLPSILFAALFGRPWRRSEPSVAWMVASWVWAAVAWEATLLLGVLGVRFPVWFVPLILAGPLVVSWWRLIVFLRERGRS